MSEIMVYILKKFKNIYRMEFNRCVSIIYWWIEPGLF